MTGEGGSVMHSFQASYLIGAAVVVYIIFRQLQPRRPTWFRFFGLPAIAVYEVVLSLHQTGLTD
ncbi:alcohol dehydrogenase GroES domain-containing protein [Alicyclobacillus hesperidum URH17-3-68]|nr:alcohol dehydrogenase GroES domain-containing protein [Alicyclobacillus hesperidum URH17-3-68]